jgi:hypothetical protein
MEWSFHADFNELPWWGWVLLGAVLLAQSIFIFHDAQKRGAKAWLWGLYGLTSVPTAYIVYWFCVMRRRKTNAEAEKT